MNPKNYLLIGGGLIALYIVWTILKRIGIIPKTTSDKVFDEKQKQKLVEEKAKEIISGSKSFSLDYYKNAPAGKLFNSMQYSPIVKEMRSSMKGWGTNESEFFNALQKIKNKWQASQVAYFYSEFFKRSLKNDINEEFGKEDLATIAIYLSNIEPK